MIIRTVRHRGLRLLLEDDNPRFVKPKLLFRVRKILTTLILAGDIDLSPLTRFKVGDFTDSRGNARVHGRSPSRTTGGLRFIEADSYIDRLNLEEYR